MIQSMPNDERHRLPPSSSDLEALGVSPSPTFTSISFSPDSQISPSCTSGDIPIMFHLSSEDSIASLCQSAHRLNTATTLQPSASAQTVESVSTFGPHRHRNEGPVFEHRSSSYAARYSQICSLLGLEGDPDQSFGDTSVSSDQTNPSPSPSPSPSKTSFLGNLLSREFNVPPSGSDATLDSPRRLSRTPSKLSIIASLHRAPSNDSLTPRHLSPACSGEYLPTDRSSDSLTGTLRRISSWTTFRIGGQPSAPSSPSPSVTITSEPTPPTARGTLSRSAAQYNMRPSERPSSEVQDLRKTARHQYTPSFASEKTVPAHSLSNAFPQSSVQHPFLPKSLMWLEDASLQILIDQEGFRLADPSFRLAGYSIHARSLDPEDPTSGGGAVQFMPARREMYHFHYAPLDGLPMMRRVMVNKDESRDFISRHASISLKSNGVYTVHGCETAVFQQSATSGDQLKLKWRFDYMVDDRRHEVSGRIMQGEKTLTPLTFSCSPMLVHPLQGKKVGLMQVMKKSVATKLVAEKMEPPAMLIGTAPVAVPHTPGHKSTPSGPTNFIKAGWKFHKRALSQGTKKGRRGDEPSSPQVGKENGDSASSPTRGHRRSASMPKQRASPVSGMTPVKGTQTSPKISRHIIPRAQLAEIMNRRDSVGACVEKSQPDSVVVQPLSHKPRRRVGGG